VRDLTVLILHLLAIVALRSAINPSEVNVAGIPFDRRVQGTPH
jgi:hypothetical protein